MWWPSALKLQSDPPGVEVGMEESRGLTWIPPSFFLSRAGAGQLINWPSSFLKWPTITFEFEEFGSMWMSVCVCVSQMQTASTVLLSDNPLIYRTLRTLSSHCVVQINATIIMVISPAGMAALFVQASDSLWEICVCVCVCGVWCVWIFVHVSILHFSGWQKKPTPGTLTVSLKQRHE